MDVPLCYAAYVTDGVRVDVWHVCINYTDCLTVVPGAGRMLRDECWVLAVCNSPKVWWHSAHFITKVAGFQFQVIIMPGKIPPLIYGGLAS